MPTFRIVGLRAEPFARYFEMSDDALAQHGARRVVADEEHAFPCRVSLADATIGDELLLVPFEHQPADSAYRGSGAIYVREGVATGVPAVGEIPDQVRRRLISVRGYDVDGWMVDAEVCQGTGAAAEITRQFGNPSIAYIHLHNARRGCFACRVERIAD